MSSGQKKKVRGQKEQPAKYYTAGMLHKLLAAKHSKDLCVPECKAGSTWMSRIRIIDFWAMKRSWANPRYYAYEIKVSRGDFLQDEKWTAYLDYCTDFYFCAPPGLIKPEELPPEAGLMVCSKNAKCLYTIKKAPIRKDVVPPLPLFLYILMSRTAIRNYDMDRSENNRAFWEDWLTERKLDHELGRQVSAALNEKIKQEIDQQAHKNNSLQVEVEKYKDVKEMLAELGLSIRQVQTWSKDGLRQQLEEAAGGMPQGFERRLEQTNEMIANLLNLIRSPRKGCS